MRFIPAFSSSFCYFVLQLGFLKFLVISFSANILSHLFQANPCQHPIIILPPEVRFADLEKLLRFIYQGEVNVHQENLARFLKTAEMLKIRGLAEDSEKVIIYALVQYLNFLYKNLFSTLYCGVEFMYLYDYS